MEELIQLRMKQWTEPPYDDETRAAAKKMQEEDPAGAMDAFYRNLEFGTGGLRGIMGVGTNRINRYTIGMATQGFANYLKSCFQQQEIKVAIAHDSRNNSRLFAEITANVMAANGIRVFLFEQLRPTPELSFAIRHLGCQGGVVCTASHNPREYNGYKAYWDDGGQLVPPHDARVIAEVEKIASVNDVKWEGGSHLITMIGKELDEAYLEMVKGLSIYPDVIARQKDLKIVYTPIHGTGIMLVPAMLKKLGFTNVHLVEAQTEPNGDFPTVVYPNPEESEAMSLGLKLAQEMDADILLGTDPDADRVGIGVKNDLGEWVLLNGNQTAVLAFNYMMEARKVKGLTQPNDMVVKTIVTTDMIEEIASQNSVRCYSVLTGFKWIAELIKEKEGRENYIIGGEESYGLLIGDKLRDKDAVSAVGLLCEMAAYEKDKGNTLFQKLVELYRRYGFYKEHLVSITKKGMDGQAQIAAMMESFRKNPPRTLVGTPVSALLDYEKREATDLESGKVTPISLPKSNVLQFVLKDGSKISARPSGTEPKIKFYFSVKSLIGEGDNPHEKEKELDHRIRQMVEELKL